MRKFCIAITMLLVSHVAWAATLTWTDMSSGSGQEDYFAVERKPEGGTYSEIGRTAPNVQRFIDTQVTPGGTYLWRVRAGNAAGSSAYTTEVSLLIPPVVVVPPAAINCGPVLALGFNATRGTVATDSSGQQNHGMLVGPTWTAAGKFGGALAFDGLDDWVTVPDAPSLGVTTDLTVASWVFPTTVIGWRTAVLKEQPGGLIWSLYIANGSQKPTAVILVGTTKQYLSGPSPLPLNTFSHIAMSYDGAAYRLYVDGKQVASKALTGKIATSTGVLRIGGNAIWGEYANGKIDDVQIYARSLSAREIQVVMGTPLP